MVMPAVNKAVQFQTFSIQIWPSEEHSYNLIINEWQCLFCRQDGSSKRLGRKEV